VCKRERKRERGRERKVDIQYSERGRVLERAYVFVSERERVRGREGEKRERENEKPIFLALKKLIPFFRVSVAEEKKITFLANEKNI